MRKSMYLVYTADDDLNRFQDEVESKGKESIVYKADETEIEEIHKYVRERYRDIECIVYLDIPEEKLLRLAVEVSDIEPDIYQLAVLEKIRKEKSLKSNLDDVVRKDDWVEIQLLKKLEEHFSQEESRELKESISSTQGNISIFMHDDPDLDAIASAMALEEICEKENVGVETYFAGSFGHPETEIFMKNTDFLINKIDEESIEDVLEGTKKVAFVDFAKSSMSDIIPDSIDPDLVIDHHKTNKKIRAKEYTEIRTDVGATSTLMTQHLKNLDVPVSPVLASALLLGIKVDTHNYTKNISSEDYQAISYLNSRADKDILDVLENTPIYSETVSAMGRAISNREFKDSVMTTFCGKISHRDDIAQIANFLLRERDILTVLVCGVKDKKIHMSARSKDLQLNIGKVMEEAYSEIGGGGGHPHAGGGEVEMAQFTDVEEAVDNIKKRFQNEVFDR